MIHALYFFVVRFRYILCIALCVAILFSCSLSGSDGGTSSAGSDGSSSGSSQPGSIDTTVGTEGKVITSFGTGDDAINALALQEDGKIIAVGFATQDINMFLHLLVKISTDPLIYPLVRVERLLHMETGQQTTLSSCQMARS